MKISIPMVWRNCFGLFLKTSLIGAVGRSSAASSFWYSGVSSILVRMMKPTAASGRVSRNGMRQAQEVTVSSSKIPKRTATTPDASRNPSTEPNSIHEQLNPRRDGREYSARYAVAEPNSPPAAMP